jgi:DNA mismatch endonuclease Vsr
MVDTVNKQTRSRMMSGIRGKNTKPELLVRSYLHRQGFRFRLHDRSLPGSPDLVFKGRHAVVEVRGCFWHQHTGCRKAYAPQSNGAFWRKKLAGNAARDQINEQLLKSRGWRVFVIWECQVKTLSRLSALASELRLLPHEPRHSRVD